MLLTLIGSSEEVEELRLGAAFSDHINIDDTQSKSNERLQKRKRQPIQNVDTSCTDTVATIHAIEVPLSHICPPPLAFPKSAYTGALPFLPHSSETSALREILVGQGAFHDYFKLANNTLFRLMNIGRAVPNLKMADLFQRPCWTVFQFIERIRCEVSKSTSGQWNLHKQMSSSPCMRSMSGTPDVSASMGG